MQLAIITHTTKPIPKTGACIPISGSASGLDILNKERETLADAITASAGQCLGFYPVFQAVLAEQDIKRADVRAAIDCFNSLCVVLNLCKLAATPGAVTPMQLHKAIVSHLEKFKRVYGSAAWVPKFHLSIHLPQMLNKFSVLLACFVLERKHKEPKRFGSMSRAVSKDPADTNWETGIMKNVLRVQLQDLHEGHGLPNTSLCSGSWKTAPRAVVKSCAQCGIIGSIQVSISVTLRGHLHVHQGDVASVQLENGRCTGEVWYHLKVGDTFKTCISIWHALPRTNMFLVQDAPIIVDTECILNLMVHRRVGSTVLVVPM